MIESTIRFLVRQRILVIALTMTVALLGVVVATNQLGTLEKLRANGLRDIAPRVHAHHPQAAKPLLVLRRQTAN